MNGWDLRKGLALLVASNAVFLERLASPVVYRRNEAACVRLAELAQAAAHLPALSYHYDCLARRHWAEAPASPIRFKTLFYTLRSALALVWMRHDSRLPPMDEATMMAGLELPASLMAAIERSRALKLDATESDTTEVPPEIGAFLNDTLSNPVPRAAAWDRSHALENVVRLSFGWSWRSSSRLTA